MTEYEHQLVLHDELRALLEQIRAGKACFRNPAALNIPNPPVVGPSRALRQRRFLPTSRLAPSALTLLSPTPDGAIASERLCQRAWFSEPSPHLPTCCLRSSPGDRNLAFFVRIELNAIAPDGP